MLDLMRNHIKTAIYGMLRLLPIKKNRVLLLSYYGEQYSGSPKYISRYLSKQSDLELIWAFTDAKKHANVPAKIVRYGHFDYYYALATAGIIVTNYRMTQEFCKRPGQKYIQTWHSSLRLKQIEKDAEDSLPVHYVEMAKRDSEQIDYLLAGSQKSREIFERAFWYSGTILNCGTPQCDILFENREELQKKVRAFFGIDEDCRIILYAPTFRKNEGVEIYKLDFELILQTLQSRFGGKWVVLLRLHPHLINQLGDLTYSERVLQATKYDDVQELLCAADALLSDYSAIMFDYALTDRPCFLYTPDLKEYIAHDRALYFDPEGLPFPLAETQEELIENIKGFSMRTYEERLSKFLNSIGTFDDGHAAERVYQIIMGEIKNERNRIHNGRI